MDSGDLLAGAWPTTNMATQNALGQSGIAAQARKHGSGTPAEGGAVSSVSSREILIVGDEKSLARCYESPTVDRFTTLTASTTHRALEALSSGAFDVVVCDDQWLRRSGSRLLRRLRQRDGTCQTLLLTSAVPTKFRANHRVQLPAANSAVLDAIDTARRVALYERTIEALLTLQDRKRVLERQGTPRDGRIRQVNERIEALHGLLDDTLSDIEHQYVALIRDRQRVPESEG